MRCLILITLPFLLIGCKKYKAKKLSGNYTCDVYQQLITLNGPTDTNYISNINVIQDNKTLKIFNYTIPIEEVCKGQKYEVPNVGFMGVVHVQFIRDSLFVQRKQSSSGAHSNISYAGTKN